MHTAPANRTARLFAGFALLASAAAAAQTDACALLSSAAIRQATGQPVSNTKLTSETAGDVRQSQCFYTLPTFTDSISVTLTTPTAASRGSARELWDRKFHKTGEPDEEEGVAQSARIAGLGDEAFWIRSFVGNLYVRKGNQFFRISLGGKMTDDERQARARALAAAALRRLH